MSIPQLHQWSERNRSPDVRHRRLSAAGALFIRCFFRTTQEQCNITRIAANISGHGAGLERTDACVAVRGGCGFALQDGYMQRDVERTHRNRGSAEGLPYNKRCAFRRWREAVSHGELL